MVGQPPKTTAGEDHGQLREHIQARFRAVRDRTMDLAAPLTAEDQCIQSMADVSPTK